MKRFIIIFVTLFILLHDLFSISLNILEKTTNEEYEEILNKGKKYYFQKKYKQAIKEWDPLIINNEINNELKELLSKTYKITYHSRSNYYQGLTCYKKNQLLKAREHFTKVNDINPYYKDTVNMLYITEKNIIVKKYQDKASDYIIKKDYNNTIDTCEKLLIIDLDNQYVRDLKEQALLLKNEEEKEKKIKIDQFILSGITSYSNKEYSRAREAFSNVLVLNKNNIDAAHYLNLINNEIADYFEIAENCLDEKKYDEAIEVSEKLVSMQNNNPEVEELIKTIYLSEMMDIKDTIINKMTDNGISFFSNMKYEEAKERFVKILIEEPENDTALSYIGRINKINSEICSKKKNEKHKKKARIIVLSQSKDPEISSIINGKDSGVDLFYYFIGMIFLIIGGTKLIYRTKKKILL